MGRSERPQVSGDWHSRDTVGRHFVVGETDTLKTERLPEAHPLMGRDEDQHLPGVI